MATNNAINYDKIVPTFLAYSSTGTTDVTGDGTVFNCLFNSIHWNINTNYSTATSIFTASRAGQYYFGASIVCSNTAGLGAIELFLVTTPATYSLCKLNCNTMTSDVDAIAIQGNTEVFLANGQTAKIQLKVSGGAKKVDLLGTAATTPRSVFYGYLACPA